MDIAPFTSHGPASQAESRQAEAAVTAIDAALFRAAFRKLAGGVSVVTVGAEGARSGFTATSVSSFSASPPTVVFSLGVASSSYPLIERHRAVGVHLLGGAQQAVADAFAGRGGRSGEARYEGFDWIEMPSGASALAEAEANVDCLVEEILDRHSHAIVLGSVASVRIARHDGGSLVYRRGRFRTLMD